MIRISFVFIVIFFLAGCANDSSVESISTPTVIAPTIISLSPTAGASTESQIHENPALAENYKIQEYSVPPGSHPHDVAPAPDGTVWYTAQYSAALGKLDPATGKTVHIPLGSGSAPHGVIVGPDGVPWITDGGLNAETLTSTQQFSTVMAYSGLRDRMESMAVSIHQLEKSRSSKHCAGAVHMASQQLRMARFTMRHWRIVMSVVSIHKQAR